MRLTSAGVLPISSTIEHRFAQVKINFARNACTAI
jgi:hypothetical protein